MIILIPVDGMTVGRSTENDLPLPWDREVSRFHAELAKRGGQWTISDEGLAKNGTFVQSERVVGRRRLVDGDQIRCGQTLLIFRDPAAAPGFDTTQLGSKEAPIPELTRTQLDVLTALSRPILGRDTQITTPATNREIADELFLSIDAVKGHLRVLFSKFDLAELPQNHKRTALVSKAVAAGLVRST